MTRTKQQSRRGIATVELAILLPLLALLVVIAVDWGRAFYYAIVVSNCARNGAMYASDPYSSIQSPYTSLSQAALADAPNLSPQPSVTSASGSDTNGTYVDCTVTCDFQTITNFPGVWKTTTISRTVRVYQAPKDPS
jgi:Flp pilus assembly protein TadG